MDERKYSNTNGSLPEARRNGNGSTSGGHSQEYNSVDGSGAGAGIESASIQHPVNETYNDDETDDECCIYTYKGDSRVAADLPSSFFNFDQGDSLSSADESCVPSCSQPYKRRAGYDGIEGFSTATTHHQTPNGSVVTVSRSRVNGVGRAQPPNDLFSPDMDFLEMDFDPGGFGDDEDDASVEDLNGGIDENGGAKNGPNPVKTQVFPNSHPEHQEIDVPDSPRTIPPTVLTPHPCSSSEVASTSLQSAPVVSSIIEPSNPPSASSSIKNSLSPLIPPKSSYQHQRSFHFSNPPIGEGGQGPSNPHLSPHLLLGPEPWNSRVPPSRQLMMRLVKSNTLPEMPSHRIDGARADGEVGEDQIPGSSRIARNPCGLSSSTPLIKNEPCYRAVINTSPKSTRSEDDFVEFDVDGIMIWTEEDVLQKSLLQIGTSACGATAVCNVLKALGFDQIDPDYVNSCVKTRLRNNGADIPEYLFSRSIAGATHLDLIHGAVEASNGLVNGRFFQPKPGIEAGTFCKWLLHWICKGAVPVVTRNMQVSAAGSSSDNSRTQIPDAWHHQMIFGISPDKIFMTNPIEGECPSLVIAQITSPSVLLVRRSDVIDRKTPSTDLRKITRHPNPEWNELNVLGQVANILLEEVPVFSSHSIAKRIRTTHILIPAAYKGGVTLFMPKNSSFYPLLMAAPEL